MIDRNNFERVCCELVAVQAKVVLDDVPFLRNHLEITAEMLNYHADRAAFALRSYVLGMKCSNKPGNIVRWPRNWWQAFKERWFPDWWIRRWPVQYSTAVVNGWNVCPHLNVKAQGPHLMFMLGRHTPINYDDFSATT